MSRNEYNRNSDIGFHQLGLEVETAQSRQAHVEHEAARHIRAPSLQKFLGRCENFNPQLDGLKKSRQRLAHRGVVVHNEDDRLACARKGLR